MSFHEDIKGALESLRKGEIILYPTDTIWGLGCDATNTSAVEKIFRIKSREETKSLIILTDSIQMTERYVKDIPEIAYQLTEVANTPLTIIYSQGRNLASGICNSDGSVGIRVCQDDFCKELINRFRKPLVSTSANFSGTKSPGNFAEIDKSLVDSVNFVVKYRQDEVQQHTASSIIKIGENGTIKIIRS